MNIEKYLKTFEELKNDPKVMAMSSYSQHGSSNSYEHSINVTLASMYLAQALNVNVSEEEMATGAMLHDFYLYDIDKSGYSAWTHGTKHPEKAYENASKEFDLTEKERDIIVNHMWPLTLTHIPHSKEAWIVSMADKYCATRERLEQIVLFIKRLKPRIASV